MTSGVVGVPDSVDEVGPDDVDSVDGVTSGVVGVPD